MGAFFDSTCYADAAAAAAAVCAAKFPQASTDSSGNPVVMTCASTGAAVELTVAGPAASAAYTQSLTFPACDPMEHYADMGAMWGYGLLALATLAALRMAFRPIWSNT